MDKEQCCKFVSRITNNNVIQPNDQRVIKLYDGYSKLIGRDYLL